MKHLFGLLALVALLMSAAPQALYAQDEIPKHGSPQHKHSVTLSPLHLERPELYASYEHKITKKISVGFNAGIGKYDDLPIWELGAKWSYYVIGTFEHGLPLTAELGYAHVTLNQQTSSSNISATGNGIYAGPTAGYKYIADYGLTINVAAGIQYIAVSASATDHDSGKTVSGSGDRIGPLLRLLVGWSF